MLTFTLFTKLVFEVSGACMSFQSLGLLSVGTIQIGFNGTVPNGLVLVPVWNERKCVARRKAAGCPDREAGIGVGIAFDEAQCLT